MRHVELDLDDPPRLPESPLIERAAPELWLGPRVLKGGGHIKVVWTYGVGAETGRIRNFQVGARPLHHARRTRPRAAASW